MNFKVCLAPILALLISTAGADASSSGFTIITEEWPPFNYTEDNELKGSSTAIVKRVMNDLGLKDKILVLPSARARVTLDTTPRSLLFSFILTPERKPLFKWIGPIGEQSIYFYKRKGSQLRIETLEDAKKVHAVCARDHGLVFSILKEAGFKNLEVSSSASSIYLKAINGRCDLAISEAPLGVTYWLEKSNQPLDALEQTPLKLISSPLYIVASKDIPDEEIAAWQRSVDKFTKMTSANLVSSEPNQ